MQTITQLTELDGRLERSSSRLAELYAQQALLHAQVMDELYECYQVAEAKAKDTSWASDFEMTFRTVAAEVAGPIRTSDRIVYDTMHHAFGLAQFFPLTHAALRGAQIWEAHAKIIIQAAQHIDDQVARDDYETAVLIHARIETPSRLRAIAKRLADLYATKSIDERHEEAKKDQCVRVYAIENGMAELSAIIPAAEAYAIKDRLTTMAYKLDDPTRTTSELKAAALIDLLLNAQPTSHVHSPVICKTGCKSNCANICGKDTARANGTDGVGSDGVGSDGVGSDGVGSDGVGSDGIGSDGATYAPDHECDEHGCALLSGIKGRVQVTLPLLSLLPPEQAAKLRSDNTFAELTQLPGFDGAAILSGYGPIDTATARRITGETPSWTRLLIDPVKAIATSVDRYRPSNEQRFALAARDIHCRFPGCTVAAYCCDLDHTVDAALGGQTTNSNLAHLCRRHHTLKHHGGWKVSQGEHGELYWTSPLGRKYTEYPPGSSMFQPPPDRSRYTSPDFEPPTEAELASLRTLMNQAAPLDGDDDDLPPF